MKAIEIRTKSRIEFVDITDQIISAVRDELVKDGVCYVFVPHTTAGITVNENADPSVVKDIIERLDKIAPYSHRYHHTEGNADAHIKSSIVGHSIHIFVQNGRLVLGTWQGIFFCEFDGPRQRRIYVKFIK